LNLGQLFSASSRQSLVLDLIPRSPTLQDIPTVSTYHDSPSAPVPLLPPIADPQLQELPFIHRGTVPENILHNNANSHYERLEFLGDAYIELAATRFLFERFPNKSVGSIAHMREDLVKNETLAGFSLMYNFDERARLSEQYRNEFARGAHASKPYVKILGDMFEAFVAAAVISHPKLGYGAVEGWLWALWRRKLPGKQELQSINGMAKAELARKVMGKGIKLVYEDVGEPVDKGVAGRLSYTVRVKIYGWGWEGVELGRGEDWGKPPAGVRAAMQALQNPLTGQIQEIKKTFDTLVKEEREKPGGPDPEVLKHLDEVWKHAPRKELGPAKPSPVS
jgi:ribonuclease-3